MHSFIPRIFSFSLSIVCFLAIMQAQTTHQVEVGGSTAGGPLPYYEPAQLTIAVGDQVEWTGVSGTHNINGSLNVFPDNPEGFLSGVPVPALSFSFTFTIPGVYQYHCDQEGHSATQHGTITVLDPNSVQEHNASEAIILFPVPTDDLLVVQLGSMRITLAEVIGMDGRVVDAVNVNGRDRIEIGTARLAAGQYQLRLTDQDGRALIRPFRKDR